MSYFSLTNIYNQQQENELSDTVAYYTEQNLRWQISENSPLDLTVQYNMRTGNDNDRLRLGFRWRLNNSSFFKEAFDAINLSYSINFHVVQYDDSNEDIRQMEHVFKLKFPYLSDRLYLAGFIDHTFHQKSSTTRPKNPIIGEAQLGFRVINNLYAIVEYRINQYRKDDENNIAYGLQYKIKW